MNFFQRIILDLAAERCPRASRALFRMNTEVWHAYFCVFVDIPQSPVLLTKGKHSFFLFRNRYTAARAHALFALDRPADTGPVVAVTVVRCRSPPLRAPSRRCRRRP